MFKRQQLKVRRELNLTGQSVIRKCYDSFSRAYDEIVDQHLHGRVKMDQSNTRRGIFIAASLGPGVIRVIWCSHVLAH